jgi:hypothetical protein
MSSVTAEPETQRKPKRRHHNWTAIKRCWTAGEPVLDIASRFDLPASSIYVQASRFKWPKRRDIQAAPVINLGPNLTSIARITEAALPQIIAQQHSAISAAVKERIRIWFDKTLVAADGLHAQVTSKINGRLDVEEVKSLASSLEVIDRVARRTFGLDSPAGTSAVSGLSVITQPWSGSAIIDVTPEPAQLPAVAQEAPKDATP